MSMRTVLKGPGNAIAFHSPTLIFHTLECCWTLSLPKDLQEGRERERFILPLQEEEEEDEEEPAQRVHSFIPLDFSLCHQVKGKKSKKSK